MTGRHAWLGLVLVLVLSLMPGASLLQAETNAPGRLLLDGVAAEVDAETITIAEVMLEARRLAEELRLRPSEQEDRLRELYDRALDGLIDRRLILKAHARSEQQMQPWVVDKRVEEIIEERFGGDRGKLISALTQERLTLEAWRKRLEEELILGAMRYAQVERRVVVRPADVTAYFATNTAAFTADGTVRVAMILLAPESGERAEALAARAAALRAELAAGKDFGVLARKHSREAHAAQGGDWGFVDPAEVFRPELVNALAALQPGELSPPLVTEAGIYLLRKTAERPDRVLTLADVRERIESLLRRQEADRLYREWVGRLRQDARIRLYELPR